MEQFSFMRNLWKGPDSCEIIYSFIRSNASIAQLKDDKTCLVFDEEVLKHGEAAINFTPAMKRVTKFCNVRVLIMNFWMNFRSFFVKILT